MFSVFVASKLVLATKALLMTLTLVAINAIVLWSLVGILRDSEFV
jgi:hypothetical protein